MSMSTSQRALKDPFRNLNAAQASRQKNTISIHEVHGKVYVDQLVHTEQQKQQIAVLYDGNASPWDTQYLADSVDDQTMARAALQHLKLDALSLEALDNRWSTVWNNKKQKGKKENLRVLYQW